MASTPEVRVSRWFVVAANALIAGCAWMAWDPSFPAVPRMLGAALLVLVLPGIGWIGLLRRTPLDLPRLAIAVVGISSVVSVGTAALSAVAIGAPSRMVPYVAIAVVMNVGFLAGGTPRRLDPATPWVLWGIVALAAFALSATAAVMLVPPLEDHDMEVRGTAYGLVSDFKPYFLTNREVYLPMAHPPLFHFHVAESLVLTGEIDATYPSYLSARRAERAVADGTTFPWMDQWRADHESFVEVPALVGTRAPNALFSALVVALLCDGVLRLTGSRWAAVGAAVLYTTFPETVVRSAYTGYFSVTVFAMLVATLLFDDRRGESDRRGAPLWLAVTGAFAALVDHKTVVLVLAVTAVAALRALFDAWHLERPRSFGRLLSVVDRRAVAFGAGFSAATFAWWGYAFAVDAGTFIQDHLRMHIAHRFLLNDIRLAHDASRYAPSMAELWIEFARHTGYVFLPVALVGVASWIFTRRRRDLATVLAAWVVVGSVLYTLTDWRQTKHLMNQLAPAVMAAVVVAWPRRGEGARDGPPPDGRGRTVGRVAAGTALVVALGFNVATDARLVDDFESLRISGASDVDGW